MIENKDICNNCLEKIGGDYKKYFDIKTDGYLYHSGALFNNFLFDNSG